MATARLMETWAHGLDVADALGVKPAATGRLKSIAHIGVRTRDFAYAVHGLTPPAEPFLVELRAPDGSTWTWGPADAAQSVTGSAEDFCMLVTQRRPRAELDVVSRGADAEKWLTIAQAFAGPPGPRPRLTSHLCGCVGPPVAIARSLLLILAFAWELTARLGLVSSLALPPLSKVLVAWADLVADGELVTNGLSSLYRAGVGLLLAVVVGAGLGVLMAWWRPVNVVLSPLVEVFYPMPKSALIPVTVLWLGFGDGSKILLIFLGCMLPVTLGAFNGARGSDRVLVWSARSMGASRMRVLRDVVLPSAMPELLNGIRTALALSFILLVSSELIVAQKGFGYLIGFLGASGSYEGMYAVVLTVAFLGFAADRAYLLLARRVLQWRD